MRCYPFLTNPFARARRRLVILCECDIPGTFSLPPSGCECKTGASAGSIMTLENEMPSEKLVSIIIPTYNRKHFVGEAIDSCLVQTHAYCEIIVIDDGSTDGSGDYLRDQYGDRIRYIFQENQGPAIARNRGIAAARGGFIHFLDADDQLAPNNVGICLDHFQQHPEIDVVHTYYQFVASDGRTPIETTPFPQFSDDIFCDMLRWTGNHILISSTMLRTAVLRDVGGFAHDPEFRSAEDWDLFLRLASKYKFHGIDQRLVYRRMHGDMLSDDRLYGALGRLKTVQNARQYGWERCMTADEFDRKLAARHHMLALNLWRESKRAEARHHFLRAAAMYPHEARQRRLYAMYTWLLPPQSIEWTIAAVHTLRKLIGRRGG